MDMGNNERSKDILKTSGVVLLVILFRVEIPKELDLLSLLIWWEYEPN